MKCSPFSVLALAACFLLQASALELADLSLPMTRAQADKALSRDYHFRVLQDMTVRRSWELKNRKVSVDFAPKDGDQALLIFIDYSRPVTKEESHADATQLIGSEPAKWQTVNDKRALRLGMEAAEGFKLSGDRYCFRELDEQGRVLRLAYFAGMPSRVVRWELADDARESGKTAMGARTATGASEFLWQDEERRRGVSADSSSASLASAAASVVADAPGAASPAKPQREMIKRPEEERDVVATVMDYINGMTPAHYAIVGGVLGLLLLHLFLKARAAKRRAEVTSYIMNQRQQRRRK